MTRQRHLGGAFGLGFGFLVCAAGLCCAAGARADDNPYSASSDAELTHFAADWESLSEEQRRALLTEMRTRMEAKKDSGAPVIEIRAQRRYGRLVRQPDGSVVRVETTEQIVRYGVAEPSEAADHAFGVGFEHRATEQVSGAGPTATEHAADSRALPPLPSTPSPKPVLVDQSAD